MTTSAWELRPCATLGTAFRDIYRDGELWAVEVPQPLAECFAASPQGWGNVHAQVPKLRTWVLEWEAQLLGLLPIEDSPDA